jgi:hypothetical protein
MHQFNLSRAQHYRRRAKRYESLAQCARSRADEKQLLRMHDACLALAATQDWLDGVVPMPAANSNLLAVPHA